MRTEVRQTIAFCRLSTGARYDRPQKAMVCPTRLTLLFLAACLPLSAATPAFQQRVDSVIDVYAHPKTARPLEIGTRCQFSFTLPALSDPLVLEGEVTWILTPEAAASRRTSDNTLPMYSPMIPIMMS